MLTAETRAHRLDLATIGLGACSSCYLAVFALENQTPKLHDTNGKTRQNY